MRIIALFLLSVMIFGCDYSYAEEPIGTHRVVMEISGDGDEHWNGMITNLQNLEKAFSSGAVRIEVVVHGKALGLLLVGKNKEMASQLTELSQKGIIFSACGNTMIRHGVIKDELFPFAMVVDAGVAEVVRKQEAGWSYVRLDH